MIIIKGNFNRAGLFFDCAVKHKTPHECTFQVNKHLHTVKLHCSSGGGEQQREVAVAKCLHANKTLISFTGLM